MDNQKDESILLEPFTSFKFYKSLSRSVGLKTGHFKLQLMHLKPRISIGWLDKGAQSGYFKLFWSRTKLLLN